jgi:hypothetical protein
MRDRFDAVEVWKTLSFDPVACGQYMLESGFMERFRSSLFTRIVPIVKDIRLWGETIREGYAKLGIRGYANTDVAALARANDEIAREFDARRAQVAGTIARAE